MFVFILCCICQFSVQYKDFVNSPKSDSIFIGLIRGNYRISDFKNDPVVLWLWRSNSNNPEVDSLLKKIHLRKNFHLSAVLRWEAKEADDYETKSNKLYLAAQFDSSAIENFLSFISLGLKHRDPKPIITAFSLPVFSDFRNQLFIITNIVILLFAVVFMAGITYIVVKLTYYLPALSHRTRPRKHSQINDLIKSLILLIPILVLRNFYIIYICYSILLILILNNREKNWLRLNIIALLLIFILSLPINNFVAFLRQNNNSYQLYEVVNYDSFCNLETDDNKEFLAYGLKQHGKLEEALSLYEDLYYQGNRNIAVVNNLANIYFLYDEPALAESLYHLAIITNDYGEPYFNLGLLKLKNIEYAKYSRYMEGARKRNFSSLSKEPIDIKPENRDFYRIIFSEKLKFNSITRSIYVLPIFLILILTFLPIKLSPPFYCTSCGRPVCKDCIQQIDEEIICKNCFAKFKSTKKKEIEEDLRRSVRKSRKRVKNLILYALNIIIPGAGLIYLKKHFTGMIIVCFVMTGYIPVFFPQIFVKPSGWITLPFFSIFFFIAIIIAILSYITSFSLIRRHNAN